MCLEAGSARAQEAPLGHRVLGTLGLRAGRAPPVGFYVEQALEGYFADRLVARNGDVVPVDLRVRVLGEQTGISGTFPLSPLRARYTLALAVPVSSVRVSVTGQLLQDNASGLGDIYIRPLGLGWQLSRVDLLVSYAFYVPTARFEFGSRGNTSEAQWTHEWSAGGNVAFDAGRRWQLSVLASYDLNQRKLGVDITRGSTVVVQGGFGVTIARIVDVGAVGAALWEVTADRGSAFPARFVGAHEQAASMGGEAAVSTEKIRTRWTVRYEHDVRVRARTLGQVVFLSALVKAF
jgi:hypothetical protein